MPDEFNSDVPAEDSARERSHYRAYMVRCWLDGSQWRCSLEPIGSRQPRGFEDFKDLLAALRSELDLLIRGKIQ